MQLSPVSGRFIFLEPRDQQFNLSNSIDPLWQKFQGMNLEENHRQGKDKKYAAMLNRIRGGEETDEDILKLKDRVRKESDEDILNMMTLYVFLEQITKSTK